MTKGTEVELILEPVPSEALSRFVIDGVDMHTIAMTGIAEWYPANFFLRNSRGEWIGGLLGTIWGGWLHVRHLWVVAGERGRGHGRRLLQAAENYAVERGSFAATLETLSVQARPFYEKEGYEVFGTLEGYPQGHAKYFLRKQLASTIENWDAQERR